MRGNGLISETQNKTKKHCDIRIFSKAYKNDREDKNALQQNGNKIISRTLNRH